MTGMGTRKGQASVGSARQAPPQGFGGDGFDPEEIFNMFFGNGFGARYDAMNVGFLYGRFCFLLI